MLTRLQLRHNFRLYTRCLSDKPSDNDPTPPEVKPKPEALKSKSSESITNTEKIQTLLKNMMLETKMKESEYKEKFATIPEVPRKRKQKADEIEVKTEKIEESLTEAASQVAQAIGGDPKQTEAELLSKVLGKINQTSTSLSDLILGMKVDRSKESGDELKMETRGQQVKRLVTKAKAQRDNQRQYGQRKDGSGAQYDRSQSYREQRSVSQIQTIDVFAGEPLGIFKTKGASEGTQLAVWEALKRRELTLATMQPPANYFQKMIVWTKQGKVWKFPINNEQGFEEEESIHFSEHVFLENHLEGWCPRRGPIRHFMELVCVGLSKNPFYTIQEKKDHIMWYKDYFESKKSLLTEVGAWEVSSDNKNEASV